MVELLLERGVSVGVASRRRRETPLLLAAMFSRVDVARMLLARGADIGQANAGGVISPTRPGSTSQHGFSTAGARESPPFMRHFCA